MRERHPRRGRPGPGRLAVAAAAILALGACAETEDAADGAGAGAPAAEKAPDFTLERLEGDAVTLSELRGQPVIIDFWATWCPPCEFQVPELNAFYQDHRERVEVLGVSVDTEGPEVVEAWTEEKGVEYPILLGDEDLARRFGAVGFPTLVIVDAKGRIDSRHVGLVERADLDRAVARLTGEPLPDTAPAEAAPDAAPGSGEEAAASDAGKGVAAPPGGGREAEASAGA